MALTDNLVSYWKLDEASGNAADAHGANTLTDVNTVGSASGKINNARDFEAGSSEALTHADNTDLSTGDIAFTFTCWVHAESLASDAVILGKVSSGGTIEYFLRYRQSANRLQWRVADSGGGTTDRNADSLGVPSTATWYFIVVDHDPTANQTSIQVNNGTKDTASHTTGVNDGTGDFALGREGGRLTDYWDGLIDEVGFWKRILTADERTQLYNGGSGLSYDSFGGGAADAVPQCWAQYRRRRA